MTAQEIISAVATNKMNWVKAKKQLQLMPDFDSNHAALAIAVEQAEKARNASDGYPSGSNY